VAHGASSFILKSKRPSAFPPGAFSRSAFERFAQGGGRDTPSALMDMGRMRNPRRVIITNVGPAARAVNGRALYDAEVR